MRPLTERELEIATLVSLSNKEIARELGCALGTVKVHLHNIYEKLGVRNRTELALWTSKARVGANNEISAAAILDQEPVPALQIAPAPFTPPLPTRAPQKEAEALPLLQTV